MKFRTRTALHLLGASALRNEVRRLQQHLIQAGRQIHDLQTDNDALAERLETRTTEIADAKAENLRLAGELDRALTANQAYAYSVTTGIGTRDTSAMEDQSTEPIDVRPLREALGDVEPKRQPAPPMVSVVTPIPPGDPSLTIRFPVTGGQVIRASGDHRATA